MAIGMTYREFWYEDPCIVAIYKRAYDCKRKEENQKMWVNGMYMLKAVSVAISNAFGHRAKYFEKPLDIFPKTEAEKQQDVLRERQKIIESLNLFKQRWENKYGNDR